MCELTAKLANILREVGPNLVQGQAAESRIPAYVPNVEEVLVGAEAVRQVQMMHVLGILHEEAKAMPFDFPNLDIPQRKFPDVTFQEALEDLLEDSRVEYTSREVDISQCPAIGDQLLERLG